MRARDRPSSAQPWKEVPAWLPGLLPLILVALPVLALFSTVMADRSEARAFAATLAGQRAWRTAASSTLIALLSTIAALALGVPAGFLYARSGLPGRRYFRAFFSIPFILPPLLMVIAFSSFYGKAGVLSSILRALGLPALSLLFGLWGIVLVQAFYNFPIVAAMVADSLESADPALEEAARLLGAGRLRRFLTVLIPQISSAVLASSSLVLLFCVQSFAVILLMGGGPRYTGFEVEIYRGLRVAFDRGSALAYAFLESLASLTIVVLHGRAGKALASSRLSPSAISRRSEKPPTVGRLASSAIFLAIMAIAIGGPLLSLAVGAFGSRSGLGASWRPGMASISALLRGPLASAFYPSLMGSLSLGLLSALFSTMTAAISVLFVPRPAMRAASSLLPILPMAVSPMVLALSLGSLWPDFEGFAAVLLFQSLIALPFAYQSMRSALDALPPSMEEAARVLGASWLHRVLGVRLPLLARPLLSAFAFSFAISLADIAGPLSFGSGEVSTLGLLIYRLSSAYRFELASAAGLALLLLSLSAFSLSEVRL